MGRSTRSRGTLLNVPIATPPLPDTEAHARWRRWQYRSGHGASMGIDQTCIAVSPEGYLCGRPVTINPQQQSVHRKGVHKKKGDT